MRCLQRCIRNIYHDRLLFFLSLPPLQGVYPCRSGNFFAVLAFSSGFCYTDKKEGPIKVWGKEMDLYGP